MKVFRFFIKTLLMLPLLLLALAAALGYLLFSPNATVPQIAPPNSKQAHYSRQLLSSIKQSPDEIRLSQHNLDALTQVASHSTPELRLYSQLSSRSIELEASLQVPRLPLFLNLSATLENHGEGIRIEELKLGQLPLSSSLVSLLLKSLPPLNGQDSPDVVLEKLLKTSRIDSANLVVYPNSLRQHYAPQGSLIAQLGSLIQQKSPDKLPQVQQMLVQIEKSLPLSRTISLGVVNQQLMLAIARQATPEDAQAWNRAALWSLAIHYANPKFRLLLGDSGIRVPKRRSQTLTLGGRQDLALHFLYSAILEQVSGAATGFAIGELKEISDSANGGSGFSFADLAADRAGIAFSKHLLHPDSAWDALLKIAGTSRESLFFPKISTLKERLSEQEFTRLYGNTRSAEYQKEVAKIDQTIRMLPLYTN